MARRTSITRKPVVINPRNQLEMVNYTTDQLRALMDRPRNIRNVSVIAHVDQGKPTLTDSLVAKGGIITTDKSDGYMQTRPVEQTRRITIKSSAISMCFELDKEELAAVQEETTGDAFLINLIDSPGHAHFSSEALFDRMYAVWA